MDYTFSYDETEYEKSPSLKEMEKLYGRGYQLLKQFDYNGKGCGVKEQGICSPIELTYKKQQELLVIVL